MHPTCLIATAEITITGPLGVGYEYSIDNGVTFQAGTTFSNVLPGIHTITTKNALGCISILSNVIVNNQPPSPLPATVITGQPTCSKSVGTIGILGPTGPGITFSLNGVNFQTASTFTNLSPGTYNVTVKNASGCTSLSPDIIINPQPSSPTQAITAIIQPTCATGTGTITVNSPIGSDLEYSVDYGVSVQTSPVFTGLLPGTYNVAVRNASGCYSITSDIIIHSQPPSPAAVTTITAQPSCARVTGIIIVNTPVGAGYSYSIDGGMNFQSSAIFSNLGPATYQVIAKNASGCTTTSSGIIIQVQPPSPIQAVTNIVQPTCTINSGSITITSPIGTGLEYSIDGTNFQASPVFTGVSTGTYNVVVQNNLGCYSITSDIIIDNQPSSPVAASATTLQPTCTTGVGVIGVTAPTGNGYSYSIDGGINFQASTLFTDLNPATYHIMVKNASGCTSVSSPVIINPQPATPATAVINVVQPDCFVATGAITVNSPTGLGLQYTIDYGVSFQASPVFSGLLPGTYNVAVVNASGCYSITPDIIIHNQPPAPGAITVGTLQPTCTRDVGAIGVFTPIGLGFTYSINGIDFQAGTNFTNLVPGTYNVTVKNASGCTSVSSQIIIDLQPVTPPEATTTVIQPTCSVATGTITINSPIGPDLEYSIDFGANIQTSPVFTGLVPGTYNVAVRNTLGCYSISQNIVIGNQPLTPAVASVIIVQPTCTNSVSAIGIESPTGPNLTYSIDGVNFQPDVLFLNVPAGTYTVTVKNAYGCTSVTPAITINTAPVRPAIATVSIIQPTCTVSTGSITVESPIAPGFTYSKDGSTYQTGTLFDNLVPGTYFIRVRSSSGCGSISSAIVINPQPLTPDVASISIVQPSCESATGAIVVNTPVGPDLSYSINGIDFQASILFNDLVPGAYNVTVKNGSGCISVTPGLILNTQPASPVVATTVIVQPTCTIPWGTITVTSPLGAGFSYSINGVDFQQSTIFSNLTLGTYAIITKNSVGCTSVGADIIINLGQGAPDVAVTTVNQPTCSDALGEIIVSSPLAADLTYSINGIDFQASAIFSNLAPGIYGITVKNGSGCISVTQDITINSQPSSPVSPSVTTVPPTCFVATAEIIVTSPLGPGISYSVNGGDFQYETLFTGLHIGTYTVTVKNGEGCTSVSAPVTFVAVPGSPSIATTGTIIQPSCTVSTAEVNVTSPLGPDLTYSINGIDFQMSTVFSNLTPNIYNITVKNPSGCISISPNFLISGQPNSPEVATISTTPPVCLNPRGEIVVTNPLGPDLTYSVDGVNFQSATTFSNLFIGTYTVTVRNMEGCTSVTPPITFVPAPGAPSIATTATTIQPDCTVSTGEITVTGPLGPNIVYSINGVDFQTATVFSNLDSGIYNVFVKNLTGCLSISTDILINDQPVTPEIPATAVIQSSCAEPTGTITVTSPLGTDLSYSINGVDFQASASFANLSPGLYTVTVMSSSGCSSISSGISLDPVPSVPTATVTTVQPTCISSTGEITVTDPLGPDIVYSINGIDFQSATVFGNLTSGTYNVTVKNVEGCLSISPDILINDQPATPEIPATVVIQPSCTEPTGTITVTSPLGTDLSYSINGVDFQVSASFANLSPGLYTVTVMSSSGCSSVSSGISLDAVSSVPAATVTTVQPTCITSTGEIIITSPLGTEFSYSLDGVNFQSATQFSGLIPGVYSITVQNGTGCISLTPDITISAVPQTPDTAVVSIVQPTCVVSYGSITVTSPLGTELTYSIDGIAFQEAATFTNLVPGTYRVTVKTTAQCTSVSNDIIIDPLPTIPQITVSQGCRDSGLRKNYIVEVMPVDDSFDIDTAMFEWKNSQGITIGDNENTFNVTQYMANSGTVGELFELTVTVINADGCENTMPVSVEKYFCEIMKGISPDKDGLNDSFDLTGWHVSKLSIFNEFGLEVYTKSNYTNEWYGQSKKGDELPTGTYYYAIEAADGVHTGWVYINRRQ